MNQKISYLLKIEEPHQHSAQVEISVNWPSQTKRLEFFMPSWSPGSYLMREYGRLVRQIKAVDESGQSFYFEQKDKGTWAIERGCNDFSDGDTIFFPTPFIVMS